MAYGGGSAAAAIRQVKLERECELRIEVAPDSPIRLRLLTGTAEIFGTEIAPEIWLTFPPRLKFAVTGRRPVKQCKIAARIKFGFKLARDAIVSQIKWSLESISAKNIYENCVICLEDRDVSQMFSGEGCFHRYCFSCMKQQVEVKLLHGVVSKCPHEGCNSELKIDSCR